MANQRPHRIHPVFENKSKPVSHPAVGYRMPMVLKWFKTAMLTVVGLIVGVMLYLGLWFWAASTVRDESVAWIAARQAEGWTIEPSRPEVGGFPFMVRATLRHPVIGGTLGGVAWTWSGDRLVAATRPWALDHFRFDLATTNQALDLTVDGETRRYTGGAGRLEVNAAFSQPWPHVLEVIAEDLVLNGPGDDALSARHFHLASDWSPNERADERTTTFTARLQGEGLRLPDLLHLPLGGRVAEAVAEMQVRGDISAEVPLPEALTRWRDRGGTVRVPRLVLTSGPLTMEAGGTLALDESLQPVGNGTAKFRGFFEAVADLHRHGLIGSREATTATVVLSAFAKRPESGGPPTLSVPLTLKERKLHAGHVEIVEFPEIHWEGVLGTAQGS